jgi:hypothetical protein
VAIDPGGPGLELPDGELRIDHGHSGRAAPPDGDGAVALFVPFWARRRTFLDEVLILQMRSDDLPEFEWMEAARLALVLPEGPLAARRSSLVLATRRSAEDARARCDATAATPEGAALFRWTEEVERR